MSSYISSNNNRFYVATEATYGKAPVVEGPNRIPAVGLKTKQEREKVIRQDKTGSRTFTGLPAGMRRNTTFALRTYMTAWREQTREPSQGPLFAAALGGAARMFPGGTVSGSNGTLLTFGVNHGLTAGQALAIGGEIRFAVSVVDPHSVNLNAPFTAVTPGALALPTATYTLASALKSASIFDYWSPATATQRLLVGSVVDVMRIKVNGDFHEFEFNGAAADLIDSSSFTSGEAGLQQFPAEPSTAGFDYTIIPGHLGQVWIGSVPNQLCTLTAADIRVDNDLDLRNQEFGCACVRAAVPRQRTVSTDFTLFAQDDASIEQLYQAARQSSPVGVMIQFGNAPQQLFGVNLNSVVPSVPEFDDSQSRLQWIFRNSRAQGISDDEITIAFA